MNTINSTQIPSVVKPFLPIFRCQLINSMIGNEIETIFLIKDTIRKGYLFSILINFKNGLSVNLFPSERINSILICRTNSKEYRYISDGRIQRIDTIYLENADSEKIFVNRQIKSVSVGIQKYSFPTKLSTKLSMNCLRFEFSENNYMYLYFDIYSGFSFHLTNELSMETKNSVDFFPVLNSAGNNNYTFFEKTIMEIEKYIPISSSNEKSINAPIYYFANRHIGTLFYPEKKDFSLSDNNKYILNRFNSYLNESLIAIVDMNFSISEKEELSLLLPIDIFIDNSESLLKANNSIIEYMISD